MDAEEVMAEVPHPLKRPRRRWLHKEFMEVSRPLGLKSLG
jgi:hypothetical protein